MSKAKNNHRKLLPIILYCSFVVFIIVNFLFSINIINEIFPSSSLKKSDYKTLASYSSKPGFMSYIGIELKEFLMEGEVVFPMDSTSKITTAYKAVIGPSSKILPFRFNFQPSANINNSDLFRLALHAFPIKIRNESYNYNLTEKKYNQLKEKGVTFEKRGYRLHFIKKKNKKSESYYIYTYRDSDMFVVYSEPVEERIK